MVEAIGQPAGRGAGRRGAGAAPGRAGGGRDARAPRPRAAARRAHRIGTWTPQPRFEDRVRAWEAEFLSELATRSYPARRQVEEPDSPLRTPFQRDRDRIVHSKAFRRLKHKTQVFVAPEGDHYRTRLTHTLEACGIARTVARALGLNEDLTEAIGLGHDLGHPPFGHTGEEALDAALRERCGSGFKHNVHSLRVVDVLERDGQGLNLTEQVRDGILNHTGSRQAGDAGGADRQAGRPRRLHQPRHRRRPAGRDPATRPTCPPPRSSCSGRPARRGSTRWSATSSSAPSRGRRHRAERGDRRRDAAAAQVHVRPRLPGRRRAASTSGCTAPCAASSTTTWSTPRRCRRRSRGRASASASPTTSPG